MSSRSRRQKRGRNANRAENPHIERQQPGPRTASTPILHRIVAWIVWSVVFVKGATLLIHAVVELIRAFQSYQTCRRLSVGCIYQAESPVH